jgi:hypothetical protein
MLSSMTDVQPDRDEQMIVEALRALLKQAREVGELITPRGYPHLGLAIVDSIFSLRSNYDSVVVPVLKRYCAEAKSLEWDKRFEVDGPEHGAQALIDTLGDLTTEERCELLTWNVAPGTNTRKADLCAEVAHVLLSEGVGTHELLANALAEHPGPERNVRKLKGVGPAAWKYLLNLSQVEKVKPDTMITGWVGCVLGRSAGQNESARLIESAALKLKREGEEASVRTIDHLVWRKQSGRAIATEK